MLGIEVAATYCRVSLLLRQTDVPLVVQRLRDHGSRRGRALVRVPAADGSYRHGSRLGRAVSRTLTILPGDSHCLMRSLVLTAMLERRGLVSTLVIGVRPEPRFGAHAWVELAGRPLLPTDESTYRRLVEL